MRTVLLFCVLVIAIVNSAKAQTTPIIDSLPWAPEGATWVYQAGATPKIVIKYTRDTNIFNRDVKQFDIYHFMPYNISSPTITIPTIGGGHTSKVGTEYLYNSNDSVYIYDQGFNEFVFIYHSYPQAGDVWNITTSYLHCQERYDFIDEDLIVEDTLLYINEVAYKSYHLKGGNGRVRYEHIVPNIGSFISFLPQLTFDYCQLPTSKYSSGLFSGSICYMDNLRGRLIRTSSMPDINSYRIGYCDSILRHVNDFIVSVEEPTLADNKNDKFSIYPNPAHSALNIYSNGIAMEEIMIYDAVGRLVIHDKSRNQSIDINSLVNGLYIINIVDEYKQVSAFKFVKD